MLAKSNRLVLIISLGAMTLFSSASFAQGSAGDSQSAEDRARISLHNRVVDIVNAMTSRANTEAVDFQKRLTQMNVAAPLETAHLDSAGVANNVPLVLEFLQYLKTARKSSDSLNQAFNDSMFAVNADLPADEADAGIKAIGESFNDDRAAYNDFLASLDKLYSKVLDALLFLQNTHYSIVKDQITFTSKDIFTKYSKLLDIIDKANIEVNKANQALRKANARATEKVKQQGSN